MGQGGVHQAALGIDVFNTGLVPLGCSSAEQRSLLLLEQYDERFQEHDTREVGLGFTVVWNLDQQHLSLEALVELLWLN